jgi:hypothetical protein
LAITLKVECNTIFVQNGLDFKVLVKESFFWEIDEFPETKIILNWIIFAQRSENYQMTNMSCWGLSNGNKSGMRSPIVLKNYNMITSKETNR